jgi:DNA primase
MTIAEWVNSAYLPDIAEDIGKIIDYLIDRGFDPLDDNFCWSPAPGFIDRVIIPFKYDGIVVGNTARKVKEGRPKYLSDQHPFFVFNIDSQDPLNKYVFVCEGPFDALAVDGVALLTNEISQQQAHIINGLGKEVIVIPDQDKAGLALINQAVDYDWSVAFPNWGEDVKDCADAVKKYGKLFVVVDAIKTSQQGEIKIKVARNNLETRLAFQEKR